jgi:hypothetical protein
MLKEEDSRASLQISEKAIEQTTGCRFGLECLHTRYRETCSIGSSLQGGDLLLVKNKCSKNNCAYSLLFGYSQYFCTCPVRREIYQRFAQ